MVGGEAGCHLLHYAAADRQDGSLVHGPYIKELLGAGGKTNSCRGRRASSGLSANAALYSQNHYRHSLCNLLPLREHFQLITCNGAELLQHGLCMLALMTEDGGPDLNKA